MPRVSKVGHDTWVGRDRIQQKAEEGSLLLPDAVAEIRLSLGMTQAEFAKALRMTTGQISRLELNNQTIATLNKMGGVLGLSLGFVRKKQPEALPDDPIIFSSLDGELIEEARKRGAFLKEALVEAAGGLLIASQAASLLGISIQALKMITDTGELIAVGIAEEQLGYPTFQFESTNMSAGVAEVLQAIAVDDPWARFNFMFLRLEELGGDRPVDAIRKGNAAEAALAARHYGDHGAS